jgi:hypothetical protein
MPHCLSDSFLLFRFIEERIDQGAHLLHSSNTCAEYPKNAMNFVPCPYFFKKGLRAQL